VHKSAIKIITGMLGGQFNERLKRSLDMKIKIYNQEMLGMGKLKIRACLLLLSLACIQTTFSAPLYWDVNGTTMGSGATPTGTWDLTTANWNTDGTGVSAPGVFLNDGSADVYFASGTDGGATTGGPTGGYTVTVADGMNLAVNSITQNEGAGNFKITLNAGSSITIGAGGFTMLSGGGDPGINGTGTVYLGASQTWSIKNLHVWDFSANISTTAGSGPVTWTLDSTGAYTAFARGVISENATSPLSISIISSKTVYSFTGTANTFSGGITLSSTDSGKATLYASNDGSLGSNANTVTIGNGNLDLQGTSSFSRNLVVSASNSTVTTENGVTYTQNAGSVISGTGVLVKAGVGTLSLAGNNTFSGGMVITLGTVTLTAPNAAGSGAISVNTGGFLNINATGVGNTINLNGGTLTLNQNVGGTINFYSGAISLGVGIALPNFVDQTGGTGSGVLAVSGVSDFGVTNMSQLPNQNWFLGTALGATYTGASLGTTSGTYNLGGGGGTLVIQNPVLTGANDVVFGSTNGGNVVLSNGNTYSGLTYIRTGTVTVSSIGSIASGSSSLGNNALIGLGTGTESVTLQYNGTGETTDKTIYVTGSGANTVATISNTGTGQLVFTSAPQITGAEALGLGGANDSAGGMIGNIAGGNIVKNGLTNSRWILTGNNTTNGSTTIKGGVLQMAAGDLMASLITIQGSDNTHYAVLQSSGAIGNNITLWQNGGFAAKGGALTVSLNGGGIWSWGNGNNGDLVFGSNTADSQVIFTNNIDLHIGDTFSRTIDVEKGLGGDSVVISGNLINSIGGNANTNVTLNKIGAGTLILTGSNNYGNNTLGTGLINGTTAVQAGMLLINNDPNGQGSATGYGNINVSSNAVFGGNGKVILKGASGINMAANSVFSVNPAILGNQLGHGHLVVDMTNTTGIATFTAGSSFLFNLDAITGSADLLEFAGLTSINQLVFNGNALVFNLNGTFAAGDYTLDLMKFSGVGAANYSSLASSLTLGSGLGAFSNAHLSFDSLNDILQLQFTVDQIPEPSTWMLMLTGGMILLIMIIRRTHRSKVD
jgi:autotransporter-associated beta strand protein